MFIEETLIINKTNNAQSRKLTRGTKALIKKAIEETQSNNREEICFAVTTMLEDKFQGDILDYQCERMNLETTVPILEAIDEYFFTYLIKK